VNTEERKTQIAQVKRLTMFLFLLLHFSAHPSFLQFPYSSTYRQTSTVSSHLHRLSSRQPSRKRNTSSGFYNIAFEIGSLVWLEPGFDVSANWLFLEEKAAMMGRTSGFGCLKNEVSILKPLGMLIEYRYR
jgi:hypothetical protein